jgi:GNAT superfamily N-acetyltransferase
MDGTSIEVRRIRGEDWNRLREVRLAALLDAPLAFITTYEEAQALDDEVWQERAEIGANGRSQATVLALLDDRTVGLAVGLDRTASKPGLIAIVSVFVSPEVRRLGVGRRLIEALEEWARDVGAATTSLWVVEGNDGAADFYESMGYRKTSDRQKITVPPVRWEVRMEKVLTLG